jgi:2-aminobenzoate-CoA ligase
MARSAYIDTFARDNLPPRELWPELLFERPEFNYPERLNCAAEFIDRWVRDGHGDDICLIAPERQLTYRQVFEAINKTCNALVNKLEFQTGNRVLLRSGNTIEMVVAYLAVLKAGGIVVATMPLLRAGEIAYPLLKAKVSLALCDHRLAEDMARAAETAGCVERVVYWGSGAPDSLEALVADEGPAFEAVDTAADDVCLIAFTSGTTGEPKGTMHFHRDMLVICDGFSAYALHPQRGDRFVGSAPFAFTFGLGSILFPMRVGATGIVLERADPKSIATAIGQYRATVCLTAPTAYRAILSKLADYDLSSLRVGVSAGETLPRSVYDAWVAATGVKLIDGIGGTEMLHIFISAREDEIRPGSTGRALPGYRAIVVDEAGHELPPNNIGRLAVRGPVGCRYLADDRQIKYVQNGWNMTGDTYLMDGDGYFWYQARSDDMIVSSGYNIAGPEVEAALLMHPAVLECGVVGAKDDERGSLVKAYVVLAPDVAPDAATVKLLQDHVKAVIAPYKYPRAIEFVTELPKTSSGKLQRYMLRQRAEVAPVAAMGSV